ncbi:hypothetical protein AB0G55_03510 [Streptomyces toyocaensis]|uniref:hypothetical protein n=1 Tax=Streptomyces toyocaensis TaxID=55952 RepID=UPI000B213B92|nr:hypothetical protein [Streptomyces toyocaensis]
MPRGRHRHSPPLHRMLPPSAIAGVSVVCALGPWVFTQPMVLRVLAAAAAVTAVVGAVVMRHWDAQAGKRVADLTRARASDEWRFEERVAELESDLEESRELRTKLEQRLRAKRAELAGLRNEHASLLRRYAAAEVERASVLEERRVLEIEAAVPARALPAGPSAASAASVKPESVEPESVEAVAEDGTGAGEAEVVAPAVFSPEGSKLFLRAAAALSRLVRDAGEEAGGTETADAAGTDAGARPAGDAPQTAAAPKRNDLPKGDGTPEDDGPEPTGKPKPEPAQEDEAEGQPEAAGDHERTAASTAPAAPPAQPVRQTSGHFTVPTAVAVVPSAAPVRRPVSGGGFDFFGTKKDTEGTALDAVQNEDLADVVGQEALALHKAEAEARYKPADEAARGVGQVIDLTEHDETEHIDVQGLRSAAS